MTYAVIWHARALSTFYRLPIHSAFIIDRTVLRFAETGEGYVEWVAPHHRLRAGVHDVTVAIDHAAERITVIAVFRAR